MLFLDKENFYKVTRVIYQHNNGLTIYNCCRHFAWDVMEQKADELAVRGENGEYYCSCCGEKIPEKAVGAIAALVEYINNGGRSDAEMAEIYVGVDEYEWAVKEPGVIIDDTRPGTISVRDLDRSFGYDEYPVMIENDDRR